MENEKAGRKPGIYERYIKRLLDILCSGLFILLFWWVYIIVALLVRKKIGKPVLFRQPRPGKDEKIFNMYKFRTMTDQRDKNSELLPDEARLTPFGKKLRQTSLDELPEFFNILKGDMSIVGPRPLLVQYLPLYNAFQKQRHDVRPGLTGNAQVNGRNSISWEDKFKLDVEYVNHISFSMDVKIMFRTVMSVISREGISSGTCETMEDFTGSVSEVDI